MNTTVLEAAGQKPGPGEPDLVEIEKFLYREANYLDHNDLDQWINLYTQDAAYWMPATENQPDPLNHISIMYDNRALMEIRRHYLSHPLTPSMEYKLRCSHIISNIRLENYDPASQSCAVRSNFQAITFYKQQTLFAGTYTHELEHRANNPNQTRLC